MNRRQFLSSATAVGGYLLANATAETVRQDLGVFRRPVSRGPDHVARERNVRGRVERADGRGVEVALSAETPPDPLLLRVVRREYPTGTILGYADSDIVRLDESGSSTAQVTIPRNTRTSDPWFYEVYTPNGSETDGHAYLCESKPYMWAKTDGTDVRPAERAAGALPSVDHGSFERRLDGNDYVVTFRWRDIDDTVWSVDYRVRRSTYEAAVATDRGYVETYEKSLTDPLPRSLHTRLRAAARPLPDDGGSVDEELYADATMASLSPGRQFDLLVKFVQGIRYAEDMVGASAYDYQRTVAETLVAGVGDCEDLTYLLAGLLSAAFDCETALLFQPGHVLLGVDPDDVPPLPYEYESVTAGDRAYVPVEPSLHVPVGRRPPMPFVAVYGDGRWLHHDTDAMLGGADHVLGDWMQFGF